MLKFRNFHGWQSTAEADGNAKSFDSGIFWEIRMYVEITMAILRGPGRLNQMENVQDKFILPPFVFMLWLVEFVLWIANV